ncbi:hypothetical protein GTR04_5145 [Trichophyton interdigitale]|nr:hypothetical protein GTR04_5145 [Trichophyton interdigitale]
MKKKKKKKKKRGRRGRSEVEESEVEVEADEEESRSFGSKGEKGKKRRALSCFRPSAREKRQFSAGLGANQREGRPRDIKLISRGNKGSGGRRRGQGKWESGWSVQ